MSNASRKARGMRTQLVAAQWYTKRGWPFAVSAGAGRPGVDILGMPDLAPEVKARRTIDIPGFLRQAAGEKRFGLPYVIIRPDGFGEESVGKWGVLMTLEDHTELLRRAGYAPGQQSELDGP